MNEANARAVANVVIGAAGVAAAYVVWRTPPLRRLALRAARVWLGASVPIFLLTQVREAWIASGNRPDMMAR